MQIEVDTKKYHQKKSQAYKSISEYMSLSDLYGYNKGSCSYCLKGNSFTWAFTKSQMEPYTYELLIERGWRRCGTYYYKPDLSKSCCQMWSHRQDINEFQINKDQKKTMKNISFLLSGNIDKKQINKQAIIEKQDKVQKLKKEQKLPIKTKQQEQINPQEIKCLIIHIQKINGQLKNMKVNQKINYDLLSFDVIDKLRFFKCDQKSQWQYYCNYVMLLYGVNKKNLHLKQSLVMFVQIYKNTIEEIGNRQQYQIQVQRGGYLLIRLKQYQNKKPIKIIKNLKCQNKNRKIPQTKKQKLEKSQIHFAQHRITIGKITIDLEPASCSDETWQIYQRYCLKIHNKKQKSKGSYRNFLCLNSLKFRQQKNIKKQVKSYKPSWVLEEDYSKLQGPKNMKMGCFHMKYRLENKLIGVGVVDIIPNGLSSVYFFYEPEFKQYRLGVFSSLIQIEYVRYISLWFPHFKYYYMGFYIQNTNKMNYKVNYEPCSLLCPITYTFARFTIQIKLQIDKYEKQLKRSSQMINLAIPKTKIIDDMMIHQKQLSQYIHKNMKIKFQSKQIKLIEIQPKYMLRILDIIKIYLPIWGKQLFQIFIFTL